MSSYKINTSDHLSELDFLKRDLARSCFSNIIPNKLPVMHNQNCLEMFTFLTVQEVFIFKRTWRTTFQFHNIYIRLTSTNWEVWLKKNSSVVPTDVRQTECYKGQRSLSCCFENVFFRPLLCIHAPIFVSTNLYENNRKQLFLYYHSVV